MEKGNLKITENPAGTLLEIQIWALSLAASHTLNGESILVHKAVVAPSKCTSDDEAYQFGLAMAASLWPTSEGWTYRVETSSATLGFQL